MAEPPRPTRGLARVTFRANQSLIETELQAGWTAKSIYQRHADKLSAGISYPQFARYARLLRSTSSSPQPPARKPPTAQPEDAKPANVRNNNPDRAAFEFDPNPQSQQWKRPRDT